MGRRRSRRQAEQEARDRARGQALRALPTCVDELEAPILPVLARPARVVLAESGGLDGPITAVRWPIRGRAGQVAVTVFTALWALLFVMAVLGITSSSGPMRWAWGLFVLGWGLGDTYQAWKHENWFRVDDANLAFGKGNAFLGGTIVSRTDIDQIFVIKRRVWFRSEYDVVLRDRRGARRVLFTTSSATEAWWVEQFLESHFEIVDHFVDGSHRRLPPIDGLPEARLLTEGAQRGR